MQHDILEQEIKKKELDEEKKALCEKKEEYERLIRQISSKPEQAQVKEDEVDGDVVTSREHTAAVPSSPQCRSPRQPASPLNVRSPPINPPTSQEEQQQQNYFQYQLPVLQRGNRPPRLRPFSIKRLFRKLWNDTGSKDQKIGKPLPDKMEDARVIHRYTSVPASDTESRGVHLRTDGREAPPNRGFYKMEKHASPPMRLSASAGRVDWMKWKGHRRRKSEDLLGMCCKRVCECVRDEKSG